jgi:hypothetical protein
MPRALVARAAIRSLRRFLATAFCCAAAVVATAATPGTAAALDLDVRATANTEVLMPYQVLEITFQHDGRYAEPTWDVKIDVELTSPSGKKARVGGFFYGSSKPQRPIVEERVDARGRKRTTARWPCDPADLWKARYAPGELGDWTYRWTLRNLRGEGASGSDAFRVVRGRLPLKGWVRINPRNPRRLVFEDGSPYFPIGFQDGVFDHNHNGSAMDSFASEGPFRLDGAEGRPQPPPGALFARGPSMNPQNADVHVGRRARAGFDIWRFSPNNFSLKVFAPPESPDASSLDHVRWEQAIVVDDMLRTMRKHGIRCFYGVFGYHPVFNDDPSNAEGMEKVKRLVKYSVDRWGAYVDFWEFLNEQKASDGWYAAMIPYLESVDPYAKPIATSWERPEIEGIDIDAPHWYGNESELDSDLVTAGHAERHRRFGKPVVFGEQGNSRGQEDRTSEGIGGVWDPGSARRMRVRSWTALFSEVSFVFWETSYAKDGHFMNIWIGPEERQYVRALQDFAYRLDADVRAVRVALEGRGAEGVRAYGLRSERCAAVYLHHFRCARCDAQGGERGGGGTKAHRWDHDRGQVRDLRLRVDVPMEARAYWYDPGDASILASLDLLPGERELEAPPFTVDLSLLVTAQGPPDVDRDGIPNDLDDDDDGDGVADSRDAFPLEREEQTDADRDRIGDSLDADVDGDGKADDLDRDGVPDHEERDPDGDGVPTADAVPWDAFPLDPREQADTDGDGIGDGADPDDDGDGFSDAEELDAGTDPKDPVRFPWKPALEG